MMATMVLIVASLYWARAVLEPVAMAILLTFLLSPCDAALQRLAMGRVFSAVLLGLMMLVVIGVIGWAISAQVKEFAADLPRYQGNIKNRIAELHIGKDSSLEKIRVTFEKMIGDIPTDGPSASSSPAPIPVKVQGGTLSSSLWQRIWGVLESMFEIPLVIMLVAFMLLERHDLRSRVIRLMGYERQNLTTGALDEAGHRVSRYLLSQFAVNAGLGAVIGLGLFLMGVPYVLLWAVLAVIMRFIPYVGIWIVAVLAFSASLATSSSWWLPLSVLALFAVFEIIAAMIVEPLLFSRNAGISKLAMLIAILFWTWLWGPVGLLLATPLTACLAVIAKYVPQLEFIFILLAKEIPDEAPADKAT